MVFEKWIDSREKARWASVSVDARTFAEWVQRWGENYRKHQETRKPMNVTNKHKEAPVNGPFNQFLETGIDWKYLGKGMMTLHAVPFFSP